MRQQAKTAQFFRSTAIRPLFAAAIVVLTTMMLGCGGPQVGDACEDDTDCGEDTLICDTSVDGGFCTISDCRPGDCPSEATCVEFGSHESYCMRTCSSSAECRDDHECIDDRTASASYCFVAD